MMGLERNSGVYIYLPSTSRAKWKALSPLCMISYIRLLDIVFAASYAPLLGHVTQNQVQTCLNVHRTLSH